MQHPTHRRYRSESMEPGARNGPSVTDILPLKKPALSPPGGGSTAVGASPDSAPVSENPAAVEVYKGNQEKYPIGFKESLPLANANAARLGADLIHDTLDALPLKPLQIVDAAQPEVTCSLVGRTSSRTLVDMTVTHSFRASYDTATLLEAKKAQEKGGAIERPPQAQHTHTGPDGTPFTRRTHQMYLSDIADEENIDDDEAEERAVVPYTGEKCIDGNCEWMLDASKIFLNRRLAVGGFAEVFLGQYEGTRVAVKRLLSQTNHEEFRKEVRLLAHLRHPNLLLFMGYTIQPTLSIVTEYMQRGSLYNILGKRKEKTPLDKKLQKSVALSVARGMAYLHSRQPPILHLDLKSANILVDNSWKVKLGDFGLSQIRTNTFMSSAASAGGTPQWMAPEVLRSEKYGEAADVYSYGVVLWEVITGRAPWEDMHPMQVVGAVGFQGRKLPAPTHPDADPALVEMSMLCMSHDPAQRPTFHTIVEVLDTQFNQHTEVHGESLLDSYQKTHLEHDHSIESELDLTGSEQTGFGDREHGASGSSQMQGQEPQDATSPFAGAPPAAGTGAEAEPKLYGLYRAPSAVTEAAQGEGALGPGPVASPFEASMGGSAAIARQPSIASPFADAAVGLAPPVATTTRAPSIPSPFAAFTAAAPAPEVVPKHPPHIDSAVSIETIASSAPTLPSTPGRPEERPVDASGAAGPPSTSSSSSSSIQSATSNTSSSLTSPTVSFNNQHMPSMVAFFAAQRGCGGNSAKGPSLPGRPGRCQLSSKEKAPSVPVNVSVDDIQVDINNIQLARGPAEPCMFKKAMQAVRSGWSCKAHT